jgi:glucuronoarabinoxylan endo-1,4-beta-xylanase
MKLRARTRGMAIPATLALTLFCGQTRADLVGGTFTNGTVNPNNWDQVNGQPPFYTSFPMTNNLCASAYVGQNPPAGGAQAQYSLLSEIITPRNTNWVVTGLAILTQGSSAGQLGMHIFDVTASLTSSSGTTTNGTGANYTLTNGDLLGGGNGLTYAQPGFGGGITNQQIFIFTNGPVSTDQIVLGANRQYAVEFWVPVTNGPALDWSRTAATPVDAHAGGQGFSGTDASASAQRITLDANGEAGGAPRTFALALYGYMTNAPYAVNTNPPVSTSTPPVTNGVCTVNWTDVHQRIDGFGASSAWDGSWTQTLANLFFSTSNGIVYTDKLGNTSTNNGIGLSLLRNHIAYTSTTSPGEIPGTIETNIMQMAQALGARVWSTPWTPAVGFKSTNDIYDSLPITNAVNGGTYLGSGNNATNQAYANQLANYVSYMKRSYGVNIYALSIQNEPDASVNTYEACQWTGQQIHDFATNLYNALLAQNLTSTMVMLPESQNWSDPHGFASTAMSDPNVAAEVGIVADHNYDGTYGPATLTKNSYGKALWETEVSLLSGSDSSITNGVYYGQRIYQFMTVAQANAYHYWWLMSLNLTGNEGLLDINGSTTKRFFVFGQYSRFVRPGYYRIDATNTTSALISAYRDTNSGNFAIVAVNNNDVFIDQTFNLTNFSVTSVTPWMTTSNLSLASQAPVSVTGSAFTYTLPALSVVTFVGQGVANTVPVWRPVSNQTINAGMTLMITNVVTDTDSPPPSLVFNVLNAPTNATFTTLPANIVIIVFSLRPLVSQANTTNLVSMVETEEGTPILSATNNFTVTVNPLTNPVIGSLSISGGHVNLLVSGPQGPDYTLETTTNLSAGWQALFMTNSPVTPVSLVVTNVNNPVRFYRIKIGP